MHTCTFSDAMNAELTSVIGPKPNRSPMCRNKRSGTMHLCECAHFFAQLFWNSKRLQRTCHANEMLGHTVERAVQWADAGIDGQVTIDTDPLSFRSQTATQKKTQSKNSEAPTRLVSSRRFKVASSLTHK